jgi:hypothetical protein
MVMSFLQQLRRKRAHRRFMREDCFCVFAQQQRPGETFKRWPLGGA